ncbi:MAG: sugar isomerase [Deltaproteobacteria bacterium RIFCSPLOWO2_12_FULL_44_12]|nr:MAG: sugar isomerase [Deltaproteobacteria bacterium RIFCSPHIGHO2_01_FULL_43_49]OGQ16053.1 MAG: sugar isomerase [Deltaproteobacteria bacterium RIFCSPHIGHO2_02_FULL_44_53]OGQ29014.1 MAG: sugar isomerase [Deltaproteobacteria bacterium RIFCSPHIGHO2_12_FULL_44_21]OGQ32570.1 MAG: sugar isomerase [Deltaproteobacteria bacterium RIFCSPLOWO2_01_FULL_45_74]OGQ41671.1 MAG: sugar isomerase [Deltaproteobacteria bacterium RIFCSPLOWO2_02_FULL_44_34]OGQ71857.1 MAG: sugar isomerase [Deltaproteobacteria bacte
MVCYPEQFLKQIKDIASLMPINTIEQLVKELVQVREVGGRLFLLGVGGSAANASHAVNDFRKICNFECYTPTDNVSELSARTNDEGWETSFVEWLRTSHLNKKDALFILSVGGGNLEKNVSPNIVAALRYAKEIGTKIFGIVGRDGGYTKKVADCCLVVPTVDDSMVTFHTEAFQSVLCHLLAAHPKLKQVATKWESLQNENIY